MSLSTASNLLQKSFKSRNPNDALIYEFEDFRLDAAHLMLYRNEEVIPLTRKQIETLLARQPVGGSCAD